MAPLARLDDSAACRLDVGSAGAVGLGRAAPEPAPTEAAGAVSAATERSRPGARTAGRAAGGLVLSRTFAFHVAGSAGTAFFFAADDDCAAGAVLAAGVGLAAGFAAEAGFAEAAGFAAGARSVAGEGLCAAAGFATDAGLAAAGLAGGGAVFSGGAALCETAVASARGAAAAAAFAIGGSSVAAAASNTKRAITLARFSSVSSAGEHRCGMTTEITSPLLMAVGSPLGIRLPLRKVPFVDVSSTTTVPPSTSVKCVWLPDMRPSSSTTVEFGLRPTVIGESAHSSSASGSPVDRQRCSSIRVRFEPAQRELDGRPLVRGRENIKRCCE